jgi:hypothetical protein
MGLRADRRVRTSKRVQAREIASVALRSSGAGDQRGRGVVKGVHALWSGPCVISVVGHVGYAFSLGRRCCGVSLRETPQRSGGVFALAAAAKSGDQFEHRVEGGFERFGVAFDLGEEQAAL